VFWTFFGLYGRRFLVVRKIIAQIFLEVVDRARHKLYFRRAGTFPVIRRATATGSL
jgi:hypothetical protein